MSPRGPIATVWRAECVRYYGTDAFSLLFDGVLLESNMMRVEVAEIIYAR
jgi:hypothetical protein